MQKSLENTYYEIGTYIRSYVSSLNSKKDIPLSEKERIVKIEKKLEEIKTDLKRGLR